MAIDKSIQGITDTFTNLHKFFGNNSQQTPSQSNQPSQAPRQIPAADNTYSPNVQSAFNQLGTETTKWGDSTRYEKFHPGIDIANAIGTPIKAFAPGVVSAAVSGKKQGDKGYGNQVIISDNAGNQNKYNHLMNPAVKPGQKINKGDVIGYLGNSGATYSPSGKGNGAHLDYRIYNTFKKQYVNPYSYLSKYYS